MTNAITAAIAGDLLSDGPADEHRDALAIFEPLIGCWDLRSVYRRANGKAVELPGYANFGWGLRGTAIVDIWAFADGAAGTTVRYYDPAIDRIRSTWICPARNALLPFLGRVVDGRIVLNARTSDGRRHRWTFVRIERERFSWTGEICDDGATWVPTQEIEGMRR